MEQPSEFTLCLPGDPVPKGASPRLQRARDDPETHRQGGGTPVRGIPSEIPAGETIPVPGQVGGRILDEPSRPPGSRQPFEAGFGLAERRRLRGRRAGRRIPCHQAHARPVGVRGQRQIPETQVRRPVHVLRARIRTTSLYPNQAAPRMGAEGKETIMASLSTSRVWCSRRWCRTRI